MGCFVFNRLPLESGPVEGAGRISTNGTVGCQHRGGSPCESSAPVSPVGALLHTCILLHPAPWRSCLLILGNKSPLAGLAVLWDPQSDLQMLELGEHPQPMATPCSDAVSHPVPFPATARQPAPCTPRSALPSRLCKETSTRCH